MANIASPQFMNQYVYGQRGFPMNPVENPDMLKLRLMMGGMGAEATNVFNRGVQGAQNLLGGIGNVGQALWNNRSWWGHGRNR
jgi:hypothetical protein